MDVLPPPEAPAAAPPAALPPSVPAAPPLPFRVVSLLEPHAESAAAPMSPAAIEILSIA
jgi:hypothetical protein